MISTYAFTKTHFIHLGNCDSFHSTSNMYIRITNINTLQTKRNMSHGLDVLHGKQFFFDFERCDQIMVRICRLNSKISVIRGQTRSHIVFWGLFIVFLWERFKVDQVLS